MMYSLTDTSNAVHVHSQRKSLNTPYECFLLFFIVDAWVVHPVDDENDVTIVASDREYLYVWIKNRRISYWLKLISLLLTIVLKLSCISLIINLACFQCFENFSIFMITFM